MKMTARELQAALREILERENEELDGYYTFQEIKDISGWGQGRAYRALKALRKEGRLDIARRPESNLVGDRSMTPVYRILAPTDEE